MNYGHVFILFATNLSVYLQSFAAPANSEDTVKYSLHAGDKKHTKTIFSLKHFFLKKIWIISVKNTGSFYSAGVNLVKLLTTYF